VNFFQPFIDKTITSNFFITSVHQILVTTEGIRTKEEDDSEWSVWRGPSVTTGASMEPVFIIEEFHEGYPELLLLQTLPESRKNMLVPAFGSIEAVEEALTDYLDFPTKGFENLPKQITTGNNITNISITDRSEQISISNEESSIIQLPTNLQHLLEEEPEIIVKDIIGRKKLQNGDYQWRTVWPDDLGTNREFCIRWGRK